MTEMETILATVEQATGPKSDYYRERWDPEQRFRLYFVPDGNLAGPDARVEVAATGTWDGIGTMLRVLTKEAELVGGRSAILDTALWATGRPGVWVVGSLA